MTQQGQGDVVARLDEWIRTTGTLDPDDYHTSIRAQDVVAAREEITHLRTLLSSSRGEQGNQAYWTHEECDAAGHLYYFGIAKGIRTPGPYTNQRRVSAIVDVASDGTLAGVELIDNMPPPPSAPGSVPTSLAQGQLHWVACERCGGSGEVEVRPSVGPYDDPTTCAEICSACDGTGRFCEETHPAERDDDLAVPTSLAGQVPDPEEYRDTFSGIVQGGCEACGDCDDDENGECACDRIVNELIAATQRINEEASPQPTAGGDVPTQKRVLQTASAALRALAQQDTGGADHG